MFLWLTASTNRGIKAARCTRVGIVRPDATADAWHAGLDKSAQVLKEIGARCPRQYLSRLLPARLDMGFTLTSFHSLVELGLRANRLNEEVVNRLLNVAFNVSGRVSEQLLRRRIGEAFYS